MNTAARAGVEPAWNDQTAIAVNQSVPYRAKFFKFMVGMSDVISMTNFYFFLEFICLE